MAIKAGNVREQSQAENLLSGALKSLFAVAAVQATAAASKLRLKPRGEFALPHCGVDSDKNVRFCTNCGSAMPATI